MSTRSISLRDFDWVMFSIMLAISAIGILQIYSTTMNTPFAGSHQKQILWTVMGISVMFFITRLNYHSLLNYAPWMYLATLAFLGGLLVVGIEIAGAKRWIRMGGISFQVSEFVKLSLILLLARFFSEQDTKSVSWQEATKVAVAAGVPFLMVAAQPDLGSALTLLPVAAAVLFLAGFPLRYFALILLAGVLALPVGYHFLKPYQKNRIATFLNPESDPKNAGYQVMQSRIAIGSGEIWGKGMGQGSQTQLRFLPVAHTDFIFAAFSEEHGFAGVLLTLVLYFALLMRLVRTAETAPDNAGLYIVGGTTGILLFQVLVNAGMVIGYMPVTGIPLPLMSYGGSSVLFTWMAIGLVGSVQVRRFVN
jgi:rod shape determining protein RodA